MLSLLLLLLLFQAKNKYLSSVNIFILNPKDLYDPYISIYQYDQYINVHQSFFPLKYSHLSIIHEKRRVE